MEILGAILVLIIVLYVFRRPVKRMTRHADTYVATWVDEDSVELTERSMKAYERLIETCGEDYMTPREIYDKIHKRGQYKVKNVNSNNSKKR